METVNSRPRFSRDIKNNLVQRDARVRKMDNLHLLDKINNGRLSATMTLCPMYGVGVLSDSFLLEPPAGIEESRVAQKWQVVKPIVEAVDAAAAGSGYQVDYKINFADSGVIVKDNNSANEDLLDYHFELYKREIMELFEDRKITFSRYSQLGVQFPRFIVVEEREEPSSVELDGLGKELVESGVRLRDEALARGSMRFNPREEKIIRKLLNQLGGDRSFRQQLIGQYGLFDGRCAEPEGLNFYIEREAAGLLLQLTDVFDHSRYPRIDVMC